MASSSNPPVPPSESKDPPVPPSESKGKGASTPPTDIDNLFAVGSRWGPLALPTSAVVGLAVLGPPGDDSNYGNWELAMSGSIIGAGLGHILNPKLRDPAQPNFQWSQQNNAICSVLLRYAHPSNYTVMRPFMGDAAKMWQALSDSHNDASMGSKLLVIRRLISCQMMDDNIDDHLTNVEKLGNQLQQLVSKSKLTIDDIVCAAISSSLPTDWNSAISGLLSQPSVSSVSLISALRREGIRRRDHASASSNQILAVTTRPPQPLNPVAPSSKKNFKRFTSRPPSNGRSNLECTHCRMQGHEWQTCNKLAREWLSRVVQNQPPVPVSSPYSQANAVHQVSTSNHQSAIVPAQPSSVWEPAPDTHLFRPEGSGFLVTEDALALNVGSGKRVWILDSGCTQSCLSEFLPTEIDVSHQVPLSQGSAIRVANGMRLNISSQRSMPLPWVSNGSSFNVIEVPGLQHSLLSISQLRSLGFSTLFLDEGIEIKGKGGKVVARGHYANGLPVLEHSGNMALGELYTV